MEIVLDWFSEFIELVANILLALIQSRLNFLKLHFVLHLGIEFRFHFEHFSHWTFVYYFSSNSINFSLEFLKFFYSFSFTVIYYCFNKLCCLFNISLSIVLQLFELVPNEVYFVHCPLTVHFCFLQSLLYFVILVFSIDIQLTLERWYHILAVLLNLIGNCLEILMLYFLMHLFLQVFH